MLEIRGHARGGQGMVTAFEILAKVFSKLGDFQVQAFPSFGVERTGAPIQAFLRVARHEILNRSNVYQPQLVVVFDESLAQQAFVLQGIRKNGLILINTERPATDFDWPDVAVYTVPATRLSVDLGLGTRSLPIVNAAMIGALLRLCDVATDLAAPIVRENVPAREGANVEALKMAFEAVQGPEFPNPFLRQWLQASPAEEITLADAIPRMEEPISRDSFPFPLWSTPMSQNTTGNWRVLTPVYTQGRPPCSAACPAGTDVRGFVRLAAEHRIEEAYELIGRSNPFPAVCGRVCPHFCEQKCNRQELDEGLNIGAIERFIGDSFLGRKAHPSPLRYAQDIAVVGSGPAGLTVALRLRQMGYPVTVFEALPHAGGMMRTGIPRFRLPDEVLDREINRILEQGVCLVLNYKVDMDALAGHFAAVVVAVGSHVGSRLGLGQEALVVEGLSFLRQFKLYQDAGGIRPGDEVAIIGGGNTAIDVARTVLRLGAFPTIYYRRSRREMPAIASEIEEAEAEGVGFQMLCAPTAVAEGKGRKQQLTFTEMALGEPDASGRRKPIPVSGSEFSREVDHLIAAIGQRYDDFVFDGRALEPKQGLLFESEGTAFFGAGDMAWGGTVAEAIGSGNQIAREIDARLQGRQEVAPAAGGQETLGAEALNFAYFPRTARQSARRVPSAVKTFDFREIQKGLEAYEISSEAGRCLHCGDCFDCGNCFNFCPDGAIAVDEAGHLRIDYRYCKGCGICVQECPCGAIQFAEVSSGVNA